MERFWDGEKWGPNPRYKRGFEPTRSKPATPADAVAAKSTTSTASTTTDVSLEQSSVWARISARSVDILLLLFPWYWLLLQAFTTETVEATGESVTTTNFAYLWTAAVMVVAYDVVFTGLWGASPGKRLLGLRIIDRDTGAKPGWVRVVMRSTPLLLTISVLLVPVLWLACVVAMAVDKKQRSLFDFSGATFVVLDPDRRGLLARARQE